MSTSSTGPTAGRIRLGAIRSASDAPGVWPVWYSSHATAPSAISSPSRLAAGIDSSGSRSSAKNRAASSATTTPATTGATTVSGASAYPRQAHDAARVR